MLYLSKTIYSNYLGRLMTTPGFHHTQGEAQAETHTSYPDGVQAYVPQFSHQSKQAEFENLSKTFVDYDFEQIRYPARVAVYDDYLSSPRVVTIEPCPVTQYLDQITQATYEFIQQQHGVFSYTVIRELVENFIHAYFIEPTVSIFDHGRTIRFTDQGPGIAHIELAKQPGITSANMKMKKYIRGVGSGLPIVNEYLLHSGGSLKIENNIQSGCVVTISVQKENETFSPEKLTDSPQQFKQNTSQLNQTYQSETPQIEDYQAYLQWKQYLDQQQSHITVSSRQEQILRLILEYGKIGPTEINHYLNISESTAHRDLKTLEEKGLIQAEDIGNKKRSLTEQGFLYIKNNEH